MALLAALMAAGTLCGSGLLPGAISREHGWALGPPSGADGAMIHHLPAGGAWGEVRPGVRLAEPPLAMAALGDELLFVLPQAGESPTVLGVRSTRTRRLPNGLWQYDRHRVLAPIPLVGTTPGIVEPEGADDRPAIATSTLLGFGAARGAGPDGRLLVALMQRGTERALLILAREGWREAPLPSDLAQVGRVWLVATDGTVVITQRAAGTELRVWAIDAKALHRNALADAITNDQGWQRWTAPVPTGDFTLHAIDGQLLLVSGVQGDGKRRIALLRPGRSQPIAELTEESATALAVTGMGTGGGAAVMVVAFPTEDPAARGASGNRPKVRVWTLAGTPLFDGQTVAITPVSLEQVGLLGLLLLSLFASILVFIARPASTWNPAINLPQGASLASPGRRLLAFVLDLAPAMFASSLLFPAGTGTGPLLPLGGLAPLLFVIVMTITHSAITEAWTGRTLGKLVLGLRTIDAGGGHPTPKQALLRTLVKVMCPPLMFFTLTNPFMPGPAGFGTVVILDDWKRDDTDPDPRDNDEDRKRKE